MANPHVEAALEHIERIISDCQCNSQVASYLHMARDELTEALYEPDVAPALEGDEADDEDMVTSYL